MGVIIATGFAQSTQEFLLAGSTKRFSVTLGHNVAPGETAESIALEVRSRWQTHVWGVSPRSTNWSLGPCRVAFRTAPAIVEVFTVDVITPGTVSDVTSPPPNCALLVQKQTGIGGRRNKGRMYVPPFMFNEANINQLGQIESATRTVIQGWFTNLFVGLETALLNPVVLHSDGGVPTEISSFVVQGTLATQRDRMR